MYSPLTHVYVFQMLPMEFIIFIQERIILIFYIQNEVLAETLSCIFRKVGTKVRMAS